ncbi:MAG TPA: gliding motility-associated C-terminal domain-containing protein, partial [Luteibaculaceae bacterium]|nr:gliding motility-associated C-terminal domain-containing protein [Luteibaculaceae bacterium]
ASALCLRVVNGFGCEDLYCEPIFISDRTLVYIPNSFSPDGDGINDFWTISRQGISEKDFSVRIFDRLGNEIFASKDLYFAWNGSSGTRQVPQGIYAYEISFVSLETGARQTRSGAITIIK